MRVYIYIYIFYRYRYIYIYTRNICLELLACACGVEVGLLAHQHPLTTACLRRALLGQWYCWCGGGNHVWRANHILLLVEEAAALEVLELGARLATAWVPLAHTCFNRVMGATSVVAMGR